VHGDLKGKNVCRFATQWKLIDFDSAAEIGGVVGMKIQPGQSPSNVPPELAKLLLRARFPAKAIRSKLGDKSVLQTHSAWEPCLAIVEALDREGLDPLTCTLGGAAPSYDIWGLGLILFRLFTAARLLNSDEHDELDETQLLKLALWPGIQPAELRQKVFSKAEAGSVPNSEKDQAVQLVALCLQSEPMYRPESIEELLKCDYFRSQASNAGRAKLLFVSTPGKGFDPRTGGYDFEVMGWLQELCRRYVGRLVVAYDWAGSSSADPRDQQWFDQIFDVRDADGMTLFDQWKAAPTEQEKESFVDAVQKILDETRWLPSYRGSIKAQIRETCNSGAKAILVLLEGGPITRVEARLMGALISEAKADLAHLGVSAPEIEIHGFDSLTSFAERGLPGFLCDIYGEDYETIPTLLLAALPHENAVRLYHEVHGYGRIAEIVKDDPREKPYRVTFDSGEQHCYSVQSAVKLTLVPYGPRQNELVGVAVDKPAQPPTLDPHHDGGTGIDGPAASDDGTLGMATFGVAIRIENTQEAGPVPKVSVEPLAVSRVLPSKPVLLCALPPYNEARACCFPAGDAAEQAQANGQPGDELGGEDGNEPEIITS
jgi:hypothetical protein